MPSPLKSASAFANFEGDFYLKLIAVGEADFRSSSLGNRQPSGSSSEAKALTVITKKIKVVIVTMVFTTLITHPKIFT